ncbi:hypothetical protein SprV_0602170900 [Sparganum proliferum]
MQHMIYVLRQILFHPLLKRWLSPAYVTVRRNLRHRLQIWLNIELDIRYFRQQQTSLNLHPVNRTHCTLGYEEEEEEEGEGKEGEEEVYLVAGLSRAYNFMGMKSDKHDNHVHI